jgi:hypothetical protein
MEKELTHEMLEEYFEEQDRLIAEGKAVREGITYGLDEECLAAIKDGWTLERVINEIEQKYGKID